MGKGGEGGQGQQIRDEILNIMHRNDIKEKKGIWMEEWHQKLHNNTTPDDIIICEAYLAFLKADMDLSEYWRVLGEGGIDRARLESLRAPILAEPSRVPQKDFPHQRLPELSAILKSVHSGADLIECIKTAAPGSRRREPRQLRSRGAAAAATPSSSSPRASTRGTSSAARVSPTPPTTSGLASCCTSISPSTTSPPRGGALGRG